VAAFMRDTPRVQVEMEQRPSPATLEMLVHGEADVGVVPETEQYGSLTFSLLKTDPVVALLPRDHALVKARRQSIRPADLQGQPLVSLSARVDPVVRAQMTALLSKHQIEPKVVYEFDQIETLLSVVAAGLALSLVPSAVTQLRHRRVVSRPFTPRMVARHFVAWDAKRLSPVALRFLTTLRSSGG
jgi:LysR family hca operon transcriptional activator